MFFVDPQTHMYFKLAGGFKYVHPYVGKISILTNMFPMGWFNHQLVKVKAALEELRRGGEEEKLHRSQLEVRGKGRGIDHVDDQTWWVVEGIYGILYYPVVWGINRKLNHYKDPY